MGYAQIYCTVAELIADLELNGDDGKLLGRIESASRHIWNTIGNFIPIAEARNFRAPEDLPDLSVGPLLALSSISAVPLGGSALSPFIYELTPHNRMWPGGPYLSVVKCYPPWDEELVTITGRWGKWEELAAIGLTATQLVAATTLVVSDGSTVSPGMVLLLDEEQELVTGAGPVSDSTAVLGTDLEAADEEIELDVSLVHVGEVLKIGFEQMRVLDLDTDNDLAQVTRGWNGTRKAAHTSGDTIYVYRTYKVERAVNGTTAAAHTTAAIRQYKVPSDVNWIVRQVAGLMKNKAGAGFASKTGDATLGEVFYTNEFPNQIQKIQENYWVP